MNEIYARRASQSMMMLQAQRMLPTLWQATQLTHEKLDATFVKEEFMRVNGHQQLHQLVPGMAMQVHQHSHWHRLHSTNAWAESQRAYAVGAKTALATRFADAGLMRESLANVRVAATAQNIVLEQIAREEGAFLYEPDMLAHNAEGEEDSSSSS
jgi:hypothetical protein